VGRTLGQFNSDTSLVTEGRCVELTLFARVSWLFALLFLLVLAVGGLAGPRVPLAVTVEVVVGQAEELQHTHQVLNFVLR
jgi:hypothetical protein